MSPNLPRVFKDGGFTLVELLISITIIVIITVATVPSFAGYIKNQGLKQAQEQLKSDLRNVQNKALAGALSDTLVNGDPVAYWAVRFSAASNSYEYFISDVATAGACPSGAIPAAQLQGNSSIPTGMEVQSAGYKCLFFSMANGKITPINFTGSEVVVKYSGSSAGGDCRRLGFNTNGLIYTSSITTCP